MDHFIGRNKEIEDLHRFLATPQCVTIVGPGGIGKTSLAMKTAQTLSNLYEDGMYVLELSSLQDAALFTHFLYSQLEIKKDPISQNYNQSSSLSGIRNYCSFLIIVNT